MSSVLGLQLEMMSQEERFAVFCGSEVSTGQDIADCFVIEFDDDDDDEMQQQVIRNNFDLAVKVISSSDFEPFAKRFMRFLTSSTSLNDPDLMIKVTFHHTMATDDIPESSTCLRELRLSAWPYTEASDDPAAHLLGLFTTCATHYLGFREAGDFGDHTKEDQSDEYFHEHFQ